MTVFNPPGNRRSQWHPVSCAEVRHAIMADLYANAGQSLTDDQIDHITQCNSCRGALLLLLAEGLDTSAVPDCAACVDEIPVLVETLLFEDRSWQTIDRQVIWHVITCPNCGAIFDSTYQLAEAEQQGTLYAPPILELPPRVRQPALLQLDRPYLNLALPPPAALIGYLRGAADLLLIAERTTTTGEQVQIRVAELSNEQWLLQLTVVPAPTTEMVLTLGSSRFACHFDAHGTATVSAIPAALLTASNGPDLLLLPA